MKQTLQVAVWDTRVTRPDGTRMHFDIIVPEEQSKPEIVYNFGHEYLRQKGLGALTLEASTCAYCHSEPCRPEWAAQIEERGYAIHEMEGCH